MIDVACIVAVTAIRPGRGADDCMFSCCAWRSQNILSTNNTGNVAAARMIQRGGKRDDLFFEGRCVRRRARRRSGVSSLGGFKYEESFSSSLPVDMVSLCFGRGLPLLSQSQVKSRRPLVFARLHVVFGKASRFSVLASCCLVVCQQPSSCTLQ